MNATHDPRIRGAGTSKKFTAGGNELQLTRRNRYCSHTCAATLVQPHLYTAAMERRSSESCNSAGKSPVAHLPALITWVGRLAREELWAGLPVLA